MPDTRDGAATGPGDPLFVVLPDRADAVAAARSFQRHGTRTIRYASGRPWLVGRWSDEEIVTANTRRAALAVVGCCPVDPGELRRRAEHLRDPAELGALSRGLPGSFHLVARLGDRQWVQGTASGLRLVFHATVEGVLVASSSALTLATALGAAPDEERLAVRLMWPVPFPLTDACLWRGVTSVPADEALNVSADGTTARHTRWWEQPEPDRSIADGAQAVREELGKAVDARTRAGGVVSCDLSGGLDSTSVCFLAADSPATVLASTWPGRDPADTDLHWARQAMRFLPEVEHVVWDADDAPLVYSGLLGIDDPMDEPTIGVMDRARMLHHLPPLAGRGSRVHLTGIGGDHVAWCSEAYYHRLLRTRPLFALRRLRGFRRLWEWPAGGMLRALADSRPYGRWLADAASRLRDPLPSSVSSALGWGVEPRLFDWITPEATRAAEGALRAAAASAAPLSRDRGMHADLQQIRDCTRIIRQWDATAARAGLPMASPFLDDRVIEASLAVDPGERVTPWRYKPLLTAAMRGTVPDVCLSRTDKASASMDAAGGLREHRGDLLALWEDSRLARLGLVDAAKLRELARRPSTPDLRRAILYSTIACEVWLRSLALAPGTGAAVAS